MRISLALASLAALVAMLAPHAGAAQRAPALAPAFSAKELTASPTDSWITNGGNVYNQRYSPLTRINRDNVAQLKPQWRTHLMARDREQVFGTSPAARLRRGDLRADRRERRVRARRRHRQDPLDLPSPSRRGHHGRLLRLDEPRRGSGRRQGLRGPARRQARRARSTQRSRRLVSASGDERGRLQHHDGAALLRRPRDHGLRGRRPRQPRPREGIRREHRQARLDVLHDPGSRRARARHMAHRQRHVGVRRRGRLADAGRRSELGARLFLDGQSGPRLERLRAPRRQPVQRLDACDRREDRANTAGTSSRCITISGTTTRRIP